MGASFGLQALVQKVLGRADRANRLIDVALAAHGGLIGRLGFLGNVRAQRVGLLHQLLGRCVFLLAVRLSSLGLKLHDLGHVLLGLHPCILRAFGIKGLGTGNLSGQVHGLLRQLASLLELAACQQLPCISLKFCNLALAIFSCLKFAHALAADLPNALLRGQRQQALLFLDALDLTEVPARLGVERVDVRAVLANPCGHRLALGGQDLVFDSGDVGAALRLGLSLALSCRLARQSFGINQFERVDCCGLAQRALLGQGLCDQARGLTNLRGLGLAGAVQGRFFCSVAGLHRLDLL